MSDEKNERPRSLFDSRPLTVLSSRDQDDHTTPGLGNPSFGELAPTTKRTLDRTERRPADALTKTDHDAAVSDEELIERLGREADATHSARKAATLFYSQGLLIERQLGDRQRALACYRAGYQRFPGLGVNARALARLLEQTGDYQACEEVLDGQINSAQSAPDRTAALVERGLLRLNHLDDLPGARSDLVRALDIDPQDPVALDGLSRLYQRSNEHQALEQLLRRQVRSRENAQLRSALLCDIARLREQSIGDTTEAANLYRTALNTCPENTQALRALLRAARANADYPAVAKLCEAIAENTTRTSAAAAGWEAAQTYDRRLRNADLAIAAYDRTLEHHPKATAPLIELSRLYERERRWPELAETLGLLSQCHDDPGKAADAAFRRARVLHQRLGKADQAIGNLQRVLSLVPDYEPARRELFQLQAKGRQWRELIDLMLEEAKRDVPPLQRVRALLNAGELYEQQLGLFDEALHVYREAQRVLPDYRPAALAANRLLARLGRHEDLIAAFERDLSRTSRVDEKVQHLRRIAEIWESQLEDPLAALNALDRLLALRPNDIDALQSTARIYALGRRYDETANAMRREADATSDRFRRINLLQQLAETEELHLNQADRALLTYQKLLAEAPDHQPALMAVGRLLKEYGNTEALIEVHQREVTTCSDDQHRAWLLVKIGQLYFRELGDTASAIEALKRALSVAPNHAAARDLLTTVYLAADDRGALLQLLTQQAANATGRAETLYYRRIAEALAHNDRPALALTYMRHALEHDKDEAALQRLWQLHAKQDDRQALLELAHILVDNAPDSAARRAALWKCYILYSAAEHDTVHAVQALEKLLDELPRSQTVLWPLLELLIRVERWQEAIAVFELSRETADDDEYTLAASRFIGAVLEHRLDDLTGAAQRASEALIHEDDDLDALITLERHSRRSLDAEGLTHTLGRLLRAAQTADEQAVYLHLVGSCYAREGDFAQARRFFERALKTTPEAIWAADGWLRAAQAMGDDSGTALAFEAKARAAISHDLRLSCEFAAADAWQAARAPEATESTYRRILELEPTNSRALDALCKALAERSRWTEIVELLMSTAARLADVAHQRDLFSRAAEVQRRRLNDLAGARRSLERAIDICPDDLGLLTSYAELCRLDGELHALAQTNDRLIDLTDDPTLLKALHFEQATLYEERLKDPQRAIVEYRNVLEIDRNDLAALSRLSELYFRRRSWEQAAKVTELLAARDDDRDRLRGYHLKLSQIYATGFGEADRALDACRRALALDPGDIDATAQMSRLLRGRGDTAALAAHLESATAIHRARLDRDPSLVSSYRALKQIFIEQGDQTAAAIACDALRALEQATDDERALQEQAKLPLHPQRSLTEDTLVQHVLDPDERTPLRQLLIALEPIVRRFYGAGARQRGPSTKLSSRSAPGLAAPFRRLLRLAGLKQLDAVVVEDTTHDIQLEDSGTPRLLLHRRLAVARADARTVFRLARAIAHVRLQHVFWGRLGSEPLERTVSAALCTLLEGYRPDIAPLELAGIVQQFQRGLSRKLRQQLQPLAVALRDLPIDGDGWLSAMQRSEARLALVLCTDLTAAVATLDADRGDENSAGRLLSYAVSDDYLQAIQQSNRR
ncbi:MAG: tetratricopeptide repeat protein [Deltaproteobacteria bacterium]|nr:tetratricopeptide repeat protein [Deltaproteobacteria bacterium]